MGKRGNASHGNDSKKQQQQQPRSQPRSGAGKTGSAARPSSQAPTRSRSEKEASAEALRQENERRVTEKIEQVNQAQAGAGLPLDASVVAVRSSLGQVSRRSAIEASWARPPLDLLPYLPHDNAASVDVAVGMDMAAAALERLATQPCHVFWSYVLYDASLPAFLDSYLAYATRPADMAVMPTPSTEAETRAAASRQRLSRAVYVVLVHLSTLYRSKSEFLSPDYFRVKLAGSDRPVWTLPRMMDVASLYAISNMAGVQAMLMRVADAQPRFMTHDLPASATALLDVVAAFAGAGVAQENPPALASLSDAEILAYILDTVATLAAFAAVLPPAAEFLASVDAPLPCHLGTIYGAVLPLYHAVSPERVQLARSFTLQLVEAVIRAGVLHVLNNARKGSKDAAAENLVRWITELASVQSHESERAGELLYAWSRVYGVRQTVSVLQSRERLPDVAAQYITSTLAGVHVAWSGAGCDDVTEHQHTAVSPTSADAADTSVEAAEKASKVAQLRDMFPDASEAWAKAVLSHYAWDAETALMAVLEGTLPDDLATCDRSSTTLTTTATTTVTTTTASATVTSATRAAAVAQRHSAFAADAFDLLNDAAVAVHVGKRDRDTSLDPSDAERAVYTQQILAGGSSDSDGDGDGGDADGQASLSALLYEDEYDDTLDEFTRGGQVFVPGDGGESLPSDQVPIQRSSSSNTKPKQQQQQQRHRSPAAAAAAVVPPVPDQARDGGSGKQHAGSSTGSTGTGSGRGGRGRGNRRGASSSSARGRHGRKQAASSKMQRSIG